VVPEWICPAFGVAECLVEFCEMVCRDDAIQSAVNEEQAFIGKVGGDPAGVQGGEAGCSSEILAVFLFAGDSADPFGCMRSDPFDPVHRALEDVGGVPLVGIEKIGPGADKDDGIPAGSLKSDSRGGEGAGAGADEDSFFREPVRAGLGKICKGATSCVGLLNVVKVHLTGEEASGRFGVFLFCGKGGKATAVEAIGWESNEDVPAMVLETFHNQAFHLREHHDGGLIVNHPFTLGSDGGERFEKSAAEGKGAEEPEGVVRAVEFVEFRFVGAFPREYRSGEKLHIEGHDVVGRLVSSSGDDHEFFAAFFVRAVSGDGSGRGVMSLGEVRDSLFFFALSESDGVP